VEEENIGIAAGSDKVPDPLRVLIEKTVREHDEVMPGLTCRLFQQAGIRIPHDTRDLH
jgi:hypothetical protein